MRLANDRPPLPLFTLASGQSGLEIFTKQRDAELHQLDCRGDPAGIRDGRPFKSTHRFITNLRITPEALLRLVRER